MTNRRNPPLVPSILEAGLSADLCADTLLNTLPAPMARALELARLAAAAGEVPVGAVFTADGCIVAEAYNAMEAQNDATAHAEMAVIRAASERLGTKNLGGGTLWVTLEPCPMCAAAIAHAKVGKLVFAASDPKSGGVLFGPQIFDQPTCHHRPEIISGPGAAQSEDMLAAFFKRLRISTKTP